MASARKARTASSGSAASYLSWRASPRRSAEFSGQQSAGAVVDQAKSPLDGAQKIIGRAELGMDVAGDDPGTVEDVERLPQVGYG